MQGAMPEGYISMLKRVGCRKARQATVGHNQSFDIPARIVDNWMKHRRLICGRRTSALASINGHQEQKLNRLFGNGGSMMSADSLQEQVEKFKAWASAHPVHRRTGEWECDYEHWPRLWAAAIAVLDSLPPEAWTETCSVNLLYAIARDNEMEHIAQELSGRPEALLKLARFALRSLEPDAKWQLAARLGTLSTNKAEAETLLLRLVDDADEYVSRRSLLALGASKSVHAESLAEKAWLTGHEYQRIAALRVLKDIASSKLTEYAQFAEEDGRKSVIKSAHDVLKTGQ
jgi:hypothetical protein